MSRYIDRDDYDDERAVLNQGRWEHNARVALKGRRGRTALADLREALMALPEHRLIEGAVCTVGSPARREAHVEEATKNWAALSPQWRPADPLEYAEEVRDFDRLVQRDGEGVCAIGAYVWHKRVKEGMDPVEAFTSLPDVADEGIDALSETAELARDQAGLTFTLAWELAYRNDETFRMMTPEERHAAFIAWIDRELAETTVSA